VNGAGSKPRTRDSHGVLKNKKRKHNRGKKEKRRRYGGRAVKHPLETLVRNENQTKRSQEKYDAVYPMQETTTTKPKEKAGNQRFKSPL